MSTLVALVGPTAGGKSGAAIDLARALGAEILSCDSVAVYRGCDVGSAKPTVEERQGVVHHLLDLADPDEPFTAARYVEAADAALADLARRRVPAVLVGGTGLYLHALVDGLFPSPPPDPAWRAELRAEATALGWPALHARLAAVDTEAAARIDREDRVRIERALEVYAQTGEPISALQRRHAATAAPRHRALTFVLDPGPDALEGRIADRARHMIEAGLLDETRRLRDRFGRGLKVLGALGYKEALAHLEEPVTTSADLADLADQIRRSTRRFARRQRAWFQRYAAGAARITSPERLPRDTIQRFLQEHEMGS